MAGNLRQSVPVLKVSDARDAERFYRDRLGFALAFAYTPGEGPNPSYMGFRRDDAWLHVSSFPGDGVFGAVAAIVVADVDALFAEFTSAGVTVDLPPTDQSWGDREMYVRDADGNSLRFQQPLTPT